MSSKGSQLCLASSYGTCLHLQTAVRKAGSLGCERPFGPRSTATANPGVYTPKNQNLRWRVLAPAGPVFQLASGVKHKVAMNLGQYRGAAACGLCIAYR